MADAAPTPVSLITGFLGAGKTTLLRRLLHDPALADTAVLINEFGEIGLDHHLLERIDDNIVLLPSGCVCCTVRGELAEALRGLLSKRAQCAVPWFARVLIESSGLADPFPILSTLQADPVLRHQVSFAQVITVVDALHGAGQLDEHAQSVRQAAVADQFVVTKTGLAGVDRVSGLVARLRAINPLAGVRFAEGEGFDAGALLRVPLGEIGAERFLNLWAGGPLSPALSPEGRGGNCQGAENSESGTYLGARRAALGHDADIHAISTRTEQPLDWTAFSLWLTMLVHRHGASILRIKGILNVQGSDTPVAVHGVQHLVHPPEHLVAWPDADHGSRLVLIVKGLPVPAITRSFHTFLGR